MTPNDLARYCSTIHRLAGKQVIDAAQPSQQVITHYYRKSSRYYRKFHSPEGAMHLPIEFSSKTPHKKKLLYQADYVNALIQEHDYRSVLELGCGQGFNSNYLAQLNPTRNFTALDVTEHNLQYARSGAKHLSNVNYFQQDFDALPVDNQHYDLIFAVETLCYSADIVKLITTLAGMLNEGGRLIIFDGYVRPEAPAFHSEVEADAYRLLSWGFAVNGFQQLQPIVQAVPTLGVHLESLHDYTENILPNYRAFERGARRALDSPGLLRLLITLRLLSMPALRQLSAGVFGLHFFNTGYVCYYRLQVVKPRR